MKRKYFSVRHFLAILLVNFISTAMYSQHTTEFTFVETASDYIRQVMQTNAKAVFDEINNAYYQKSSLSLSSSNATQEAIDRIKSLWSTSHFYCTETSVIERTLKTPKGFQVRNIPVYFTKGESNEDKYQDIVIEFTSSGKISDIYIAISRHQYVQIIQDNNEVTDLRRRQLILEFVEDFRTAYNRKDINYLNKVFSNDALIITGKVLKQQKRSDIPNPIGVTIQYVTQSKKEYLTRLKQVFNNNSYINIKFEDIKVIRHGENTNVYGVSLRQKYHSSTYDDDGWLFLMIDFKNEENPLIWVRTWQDKRYTPENEIFGLDDFIVR